MSRAKRPRVEDMVGPRMRGGKFYSGNAARRGKWAQMKFSKVQPWVTYGAMRVARGTAENLETTGADVLADNAIIRSFVSISEINDLDAGSGRPEFVNSDGTVVAVPAP